jgi:hypothetical protein
MLFSNTKHPERKLTIREKASDLEIKEDGEPADEHKERRPE